MNVAIGGSRCVKKNKKMLKCSLLKKAKGPDLSLKQVLPQNRENFFK